jgi:Raf kinase inhibitor-like YbhB/YbcL family protein
VSKLFLSLLLALTPAMLTAGCSRKEDPAGSRPEEALLGDFKLRSSAFNEGQTIPSEFTCDGKNVSPALIWQGVPQTAKRLVLICEDPDAPAGIWLHWLAYGIPATHTGLSEGVPASGSLPDGSKQGKNDFDKIGYGGPCPPPGKPHRYFFKLYAVDSDLPSKPGLGRNEIESLMKNHIVGTASLMGTYQRK